MCKGNNLYIWQVKDLKYLFAYTVPLSAYLSFSSTGIWTYTAVIYAFGIIPALDVLFGTSDENLQEDEENKKGNKRLQITQPKAGEQQQQNNNNNSTNNNKKARSAKP